VVSQQNRGSYMDIANTAATCKTPNTPPAKAPWPGVTSTVNRVISRWASRATS